MCKETFRAIPEKEKLDSIREMENLGIVIQIAMTSRNLTAHLQKKLGLRQQLFIVLSRIPGNQVHAYYGIC